MRPERPYLVWARTAPAPSRATRRRPKRAAGLRQEEQNRRGKKKKAEKRKVTTHKSLCVKRCQLVAAWPTRNRRAPCSPSITSPLAESPVEYVFIPSSAPQPNGFRSLKDSLKSLQLASRGRPRYSLALAPSPCLLLARPARVSLSLPLMSCATTGHLLVRFTSSNCAQR